MKTLIFKMKGKSINGNVVVYL